MKARSKILLVVGGYLALCGVSYLITGPRDEYGQPVAHDALTYLACAWMIASGVGLIMHKTWGLWTYLVGLAVAVASTLVLSLEQGRGIVGALGFSLIVAVMLGLPAVPVWLRRNRLESAPREAAE